MMATARKLLLPAREFGLQPSLLISAEI